jgi:hypothetical protein
MNVPLLVVSIALGVILYRLTCIERMLDIVLRDLEAAQMKKDIE